MSPTTPDGLRYPTDYEQPADSPSAFQQLANDTQAALLQRMHVTPTSANFALASGWTLDAGAGSPSAHKSGRMCIARGSAVRTGTDLTVTDNTTFEIGTVPDGYRPQLAQRLTAAWYGTTTAGPTNWSVALLTILTDGSLQFTPNFSGKIKVGQWVSFGGLAWVTP